MRIYAPANFERVFRHNMSSFLEDAALCDVCSRLLTPIECFDRIQRPYIGSYIGDDFNSVEFSIPTLSGVLICSERAIDVLKATVPEVEIFPALLQQLGKRRQVIDEKPMYAAIPKHGVVLDPIIFKMNRSIDCIGCGGTSWSWSGDQGVYPFFGGKTAFHFFYIVGGGMTMYFSEELIVDLVEAKVLGVPGIRNKPPFGEWTGS